MERPSLSTPPTWSSSLSWFSGQARPRAAFRGSSTKKFLCRRSSTCGTCCSETGANSTVEGILGRGSGAGAGDSRCSREAKWGESVMVKLKK